VEKVGADAMPIVAVINFLIGFVMGYESAKYLRVYGADIYIADVVGLSVTRELAPIMTAIVVCGRSGAGFAAELGTMRVSEEIDALRAMGLRPIAYLVVPRTLALLFTLPVLSLLGDLVGVVGGLAVAAWSFDITPAAFINQLQTRVVMWDVYAGLLKSVAFAIAIALIACQQGFAASGGAEGVGRRTTATVVTSLFVIVIIDSTFAIVYRVLGL
jgi:phospholipid/cholesterol/gamma-HCH transport system permease protein